MSATYVVTDYEVQANVDGLQTKRLQAVLDKCKNGGGTVVFPAGRYMSASLRLWSDTTLQFEKGAVLQGSNECTDYEVYPVPAGVELRTDMEMIAQNYNNKPWKEYRRALISAYGEKNIAIVGVKDRIIDGSDCFDAAGEEGYRGPHGIFLTNCKNVKLSGYTIQNCGNFHHQLDNCEHVRMDHVTCLAGHDGIHLHCCTDTEITDCIFHTGDDCIAGINIRSLLVRGCDLNTSCDLFRMGGVHILVEDCTMKGPGYYPHRLTTVKGKNNVLPREAGRHNTLCVLMYFASVNHPAAESAHDIVFRNCTIENADRFLMYHAGDAGWLQAGTDLTEIMLDHVKFSGLAASSDVVASEKAPLTVTLRGVTAAFRDGAANTGLFDGRDPHTKVVETP